MTSKRQRSVRITSAWADRQFGHDRRRLDDLPHACEVVLALAAVGKEGRVLSTWAGTFVSCELVIPNTDPDAHKDWEPEGVRWL